MCTRTVRSAQHLSILYCIQYTVYYSAIVHCVVYYSARVEPVL